MRSSVLDPDRASKVEMREAGQNPQYEEFDEPPVSNFSQRLLAKPTQHASRFLILVPEGWSVLLLLAIALYSVVSSIIVAKWVESSLLLLWPPAIGLLVGLLIARMSWVPQPILHLVACLAGYWLAVWITSALAYHMPWMALLVALREASTGTSAAGTVPTANILFFFYLAFLTYFLGYFGSWLVYRVRLPWLVALVYYSILLVNLNYVEGHTYLVMILGVALLLLIARIQLANRISQWMRDGLSTDRIWTRNITKYCMWGACLLTVSVVLIGSLLPTLGQASSGKQFWDDVDNAWDNILNGHFSWDNPAALTRPYQAPSNFFGDQMSITGSVNLPSGEVLHYTSASPRYLEGFTFNRFDGRTWTSSLTNTAARNYDANVLLPLDVQMNGEKQITTNITIIQPPGGTKSYIFAPPQPVSFDVAVTLYSDGTTGTWVQQKPLSRGQRYRVVSIMPTSDPQYLTEIPLPEADQALWRADPHYAQLALYYDDIPRLSPNVQKTVRQWVANANDTYTAMKNLERRLSDTSQFTYSIQNPAIPRGANVIDWLLQTRVGYCTYYASAMAIMGRYLHIPTRIVNGFSQGHYDAGRKIWIVEGTDAHTWVQAYFPGYGWIDFDPTPGFAPNAAPLPQATPSPEAVKPTQVPLAPTKAAATATKQEQQSPVVSPKQSGSDLALSHILVVSTLVLSILVLIAALTAYWWHNLYANSTLVSGMFWRLCWIASKAGLGPRSWQTPYEYSSMLSQYLEQQSTPLWSLTELFVRERWGSPHQAPRRHEEEDIQQFWPVLRGMFLQLLFKRKKQL